MSRSDDRPDARLEHQRVRHSGRGALSNRDSRFQPLQSEWDDGLAQPAPMTEYRAVDARSIIATNRSPDIPFDQSINPYQGCEHGCIYCYARPTHAYHDLSPGLDFETRIMVKRNGARLLRRALTRRAYRCQTITLGANTDPYQPAEREHRVTRELLEVLWRCRHPVSIITKGSLVTRDIDLLADMAELGLASVAISVTTLDRDLKRALEPRTADGEARLQAAADLAGAGIPVSILFAPVIPALNDREMETILARGHAAGARHAAYILLRLPLETGELFTQWLQEHYPQRSAHVMSLLRQCRGGNDYDPRFGHRMRGEGPVAELLSQRFRLCCSRLGLNMTPRPASVTGLFDASRLASSEPAASGQLTLI